MAEGEEIYTDLERTTLQFIISVGAIKEEVLNLSLHNKIKKEETQQTEVPLTREQEIMENRSLETSIDLINTKLHKIGYRIVKINSQVSNEPYFVYVNTISDDPAKISMSRTPKEINVIKKMINYIICDAEDESFSISGKDALTYCNHEGFTTIYATQFLQNLVNEGWFNYVHSGKYYLSIRSLAELKPMLIKKYGIKTLEPDTDGLLNACSGCHNLVTIGVRCNNDVCNVRFHKYCQEYYARANGFGCPNPNCNYDWSSATPGSVGVFKNLNFE